jgi:pimeloyl-ACP methyl ester carboxylesterase
MTVSLPQLEGVTHRRVRVGALELHVAEAGDPAAPPLLLVHGWPQHWWAWRHVIGPLAETHRVICPDLRGHGWSDAPRGDYAKATLAADLLALLDALGLREPLPVVGHDWGGWISFLLADRAPERVSAMLAMSIPPPWFRSRRRPKTLVFASYQILVSTPVLGQFVLRAQPAFVEQLIRAGTKQRGAFTARDLKLYSEPLREPDRAAATTALYRTFLTRELHQRAMAGAPSVPYRVLMGEGDPIRSAVDLPAEVELVPGAGHFLPEEAPEAVLAAIRETVA